MHILIFKTDFWYLNFFHWCMYSVFLTVPNHKEDTAAEMLIWIRNSEWPLIVAAATILQVKNGLGQQKYTVGLKALPEAGGLHSHLDLSVLLILPCLLWPTYGARGSGKLIYFYYYICTNKIWHQISEYYR